MNTTCSRTSLACSALALWMLYAFGYPTADGMSFRGLKSKQTTFGAVAELGPEVSPDGRLLAFEYFHRERPFVPQIWVMDVGLGFESARPLVDNENYNAEFSWSPDGQWICYFSHSTGQGTPTSQIYRVRVRDGFTEQITRYPVGSSLSFSTSWSKDNRIAFEHDGDIYAVEAFGGEPLKLIDVKTKVPSIGSLIIRWSPDGSRLAFSGEESDSTTSRIWIAELGTGGIYPITEGGMPSWYGNDSLLFVRGSEREAKACAICLKNRKVECLTADGYDLSPWPSPSKRQIFVARGSRSPRPKQSKGFLDGFHIWMYEFGP